MVLQIKERLLGLGFILSFGIGFDQTTKRLAENMLDNDPHSFLFDTFRLHFVKNSGAFLGLGAEFSEDIKIWVFFILPIVFLMFALYYLVFSDKLQRGAQIMIALMVSGGLGNLIDRIFMSGQVTDFINLGLGPVRTGIFNLADVAIMAGAIGLLVWPTRKVPEKESPSIA
jgi:signal peptidase II